MKRTNILLLPVAILLLIITVSVSAQNNSSSNKTQKKNKKLKIRFNPQPSSGECGAQSSGRTIIKVTFDKAGIITFAELLASSGCDSFDKSAMKMVWMIQFEPAIKDGEAVTVIKKMMYDFYRS